MKKITLGILAHVDAGKTTLTESILLETGMIRNAGRVDNGNAFLDTEELEKKRGVTIVSKQAVINCSKNHPLNSCDDDVKITIIDTPGHVDFIGETERAMSVMDMAVLVVSGPDGVTDSTKRLASLLDIYRVPYIIYVNKMDMCEKHSGEIINELKEYLGIGAISAGQLVEESDSNPSSEDILSIKEEIASLSEASIEQFLDTGDISDDIISDLLYKGLFHPVLFGSALKNQGTDCLIKFLTRLTRNLKYKEEPAAKVFKVSFENGAKLAFAKITGGSFSVRDSVVTSINSDEGSHTEEKISQIRLYSGGKYESIKTADAGDVVTFVGLEKAEIGTGLGNEPDDERGFSRPVLRYNMILPIDTPVITFIPKLREMISEDPLLDIETDQETGEIRVSVMGEFQLEILAATILERYNVKVTFDEGNLIYKETIASPVMGYGHFEPLRHYSEVQLLLEPLPEGRGIEIASNLSVSDLGINWQKTILSTLENDLPPGVLTKSELTDIRITLVSGKSHLKHSDSQDFKEATRRAVRQALMKTECVLLEPYFDFRIYIPSVNMGRAMTDINQMEGKCSLESQTDDQAVITGTAPARLLKNYQAEITKYTSGKGRISLQPGSYKPCSSEYMDNLDVSYDPDSDAQNPSGSIFCAHGAGYYVPWYECEEMMHLPSKEAEYFEIMTDSDDEALLKEAERVKNAALQGNKQTSVESRLEAIGTDEIDSILMSTTHANAGKEKRNGKRVYLRKSTSIAQDRAYYDNGSANLESGSSRIKKTRTEKEKPKYLLVDGYNIIHAWAELKGLLSNPDNYGGRRSNQDSIELEGARYRLLDIMSEYRVVRDTEVIVVFDAYNVRGHFTEKLDYMGVHVVYTKEAETADQYIARFTIQNTKYMDITVATSDGLIQLIIRGENTKLMSASELEMDIKNIRNKVIDTSSEEQIYNHITEL